MPLWLTVAAIALGLVAGALLARLHSRSTRVVEAFFRAAFEQSSIGMGIADREGRYTYVNGALERLTGRLARDLLGAGVLDALHADDRGVVADAAEQVLTGHVAQATFEARFAHPEGAVRWARTNLSPIRDASGRIVHLVGLHEDITEGREAEERLAHRQAWFEAVHAHSSDVVCLLDEAGTITYLSPSFQTVLGDDPASRIGTGFLDNVHPDDRARAGAGFRKALAVPGPQPPAELRVAHADGRWRHVEVLVTNLLDDPDVGAVVTNSRDITDRVEAAAQVEQRALHDPLTGLANRRLLVDRIEQAIQRSRRSADPIGILYIDLDRFKAVNDRFGHSAGDRLLVVVAQRLLGSVRPGDTVARIGGDEFVVVADGASPGEAVAIAERIRGALAEPTVLPTGEHVLASASVGVVIGNGRSSVDALLRDADLALYSAKDHGRDRYEVFEPALRKASVERLSTELLLRQALEQGDLVVLYEPVLDLATSADVAVGARLRLQRPSGELVGPQEFLAVAEESGLILTIGAGVLDSACRQIVSWRVALGDRAPGRVAVDASVRQLAHPSFLNQIGRVLGTSGADPSLLALEVPEAGMRTAPPFVIDVLRQLRELGVTIGLDGFGGRTASLSSLAELPIDYVTLDGALVSELAVDAPARAVACAVIDVAGSLGRQVVADGVQHEREVEVLRELGCDRVQGPLVGAPAEPALVEHRLRARSSPQLR